MSVAFQTILDGALEPTFASPPELFQFPGGEWHLRNVPGSELARDASRVWVATVRGADVNDLVGAMLLADVARARREAFTLLLPYLPASRADRGVPHGLVVYGQMICPNIGLGMIVTVDVHNPTAILGWQRLVNLPVTDLVERAIRSTNAEYDAVIAPDKGAVDRAAAVAERLGVGLVYAHKTRDFETGRITSFKVPPLNPAGRYLVVDDICDGGGTFKFFAQESGIPRDQLGLWVTHGIFSGAAIHLREYYGEIYTTDSHPGHGRVGVATHIEPVWPMMFDHARSVS